MGLMDRDYMRERREPERVFAPPEPSIRFTLQSLLWIVCVFAVSLKAYNWWIGHQSVKLAPTSVQAPAMGTPLQSSEPGAADLPRHPQLTGNWDPQRQQAVPSAVQPQASMHETTVMKCVVNGRVTFSDGPCAPGAVQSSVTIRGDRNRADGLPRLPAPPSPQMQVPQMSQSVPVAESPDPAIARKMECAAHEQAIQSIDTQTRQPLSASSQDWFAAQRKEHRDAQFRLRC